MSGKLSRSLGVIVFAMASVLTFGWASPAAVMVQLAGTTALIMGGTGQPLVNPFKQEASVGGLPSYGFATSGLVNGSGQPAGYVANAMDTYIRPNSPDGEGFTTKVVWNPNELGPFLGSRSFDKSVATGVAQLDLCIRTPSACTSHIYPDGQAGVDGGFTVFGYSQSAYAASIEKRNLIDEYFEDGTTHDAKFVFIGNAARPNGGILQRLNPLYIPLLDLSFGGSSPTDSPVVGDNYLYPTADIARQYDFISDFPKYPLNLLADYNALMGLLFLHLDYFNTTDAGKGFLDQGQMGDTNYYMISTPLLPMLIPLQLFVPTPLLKVIDAPLRVLVELGYDRVTSPGTPTNSELFGPSVNIFTVAYNLIASVFVGIDDGIAELFNSPTFRPFGTTPGGAFGVGGPQLETVDEALAPTSAISELARNITLSAYSTELAPIDEAAPVAADQPVQNEPTVEDAVLTETTVEEPTETIAPEPTETTVPETNAPEPTETDAPEPTETTVPEPTETNAPEPTETDAPEPTEENAPEPTEELEPTNESEPSEEPQESETDQPEDSESADDSVPAKEPEAAKEQAPGTHQEQAKTTADSASTTTSTN